MKNYKKLFKEALTPNYLKENKAVDDIFGDKTPEFKEFDPKDIEGDLNLEEESESNKEIKALEKIAQKYPKTDPRYKQIQKMIDDVKPDREDKAVSIFHYYDELNKDINEEFSSTEEKMINQIKSYKERGSAMVNLPSKVRDFYFKNKEKIDALNENMGEWPKELSSRYSDEYRFELEKVSPTYQEKPGRAKYRVIDIESGELKGTPVFGKPESLMAYADDLVKKKGGTQSSNFGESLDEDINDPVLMKTRASQMKRDAIDNKRISAEEVIDLRYELTILDDEREDILMRIEDIGVETEKTAEPEGGKIADKLGGRLMAAEKELRAINSKIIDIKDDLGDYDMNESVNEDLDIGHQDDEPGMLKSELARAGQMIQMLYRAVDKYDDIEGEVDFPQWWQAKIIKANTLLDSAFDYLAGEEDVARIDAMIDRIDDDMTEGNGGAEQDDAQLSLNVSSDAALDSEVNKMGYNESFESLNKSLKEALNKRLGK